MPSRLPPHIRQKLEPIELLLQFPPGARPLAGSDQVVVCLDTRQIPQFGELLLRSPDRNVGFFDFFPDFSDLFLNATQTHPSFTAFFQFPLQLRDNDGRLLSVSFERDAIGESGVDDVDSNRV